MITTKTIDSNFNVNNNSTVTANTKDHNNDLGCSDCICCKYRGFPDQKVVYECEGTRKETEPGFIYIIETYEYYQYIQAKRVKHKHKSLRHLNYEEAKTIIDTLDEEIRIQQEYNNTSLQEELALEEEDIILFSQMHRAISFPPESYNNNRQRNFRGCLI